MTLLPRCQYTSSKSAFFQKYYKKLCFLFSFFFTRPPVGSPYPHSTSLLEGTYNKTTGYNKMKYKIEHPTYLINKHEITSSYDLNFIVYFNSSSLQKSSSVIFLLLSSQTNPFSFESTSLSAYLHLLF